MIIGCTRSAGARSTTGHEDIDGACCSELLGAACGEDVGDVVSEGGDDAVSEGGVGVGEAVGDDAFYGATIVGVEAIVGSQHGDVLDGDQASRMSDFEAAAGGDSALGAVGSAGGGQMLVSRETQ